jgi:hypothetical protein
VEAGIGSGLRPEGKKGKNEGWKEREEKEHGHFGNQLLLSEL